MKAIRKMGQLIICLFLLGYGPPALGAMKNDALNLETLWQQYLREDARKIPAKRYPFEHCFRAAAQKHDLPMSLLLAVARGESNFNPRAKSNRNCHGLMQIQWPATAKHLGIYRRSALYDPCTNIDAGAKYLKELLNRYQSNLHLALAAYNYGPKRIDPASASDQIPEGAKWYSGYILHHLNHILKNATVAAGSTRDDRRPPYILPKHIPLITFRRPFRAAGFYSHLHQQAPELNIDWYRSGLGRYQVVLFYTNQQALAEGKLKLRRLGVPVK
jgi:hypothetical protein